MYLLDRNIELTPEYIGKVLFQFQLRELPVINKYYKYFNGVQEILSKQEQEGKPCNKIVSNYCKEVVDNYKGYIVGIPVTYDGENIESIVDILNYNDVGSEDTDYLNNALALGISYEICYIDEFGKQRFRLFDSRECVPIYDNTLENNLLYVIRFYEEDALDEDNNNFIVEVYGEKWIRKYRSVKGFTSFEFLEEVPHYYNQCPVTVFKLNEECKSIFDPIMSLQDAYNRLLSDAQDSEDSFADAYMVLKGAIAEDEELSRMKVNKILMMDQDADAYYLTKDINNEQFKNLEEIYDDQIYRKSGCPNFTDEKFFAQSGIALRFRLLQFENISSSIVNQMKKALQRRIELLCEVLNLTGSDVMWRDIDIRFTRNIPDQLIPTTVQDLIEYKGLVSNETLLGLIPFVDNVQEEMDRLKEQHEDGMSLYSFNTDSETAVEEDEA